MAREPSREMLFVDGAPVLSFVPFDQGHPTADEAVPMAESGVVVQAVRAQLEGFWFSSPDDGLTNALIADGATVVRHSHVMTYDLTRTQHRSTGASVPVVSIRGSTSELAELNVRAYPPGHVDFETNDAGEAQKAIDAMLDGTLIGPFMESASAMVTDADRPVAVLIVNRKPGHGIASRPWVTELFRDPNPAYRGLGASLLSRAIRILRSDGETTLSLAVTDGNPALSVYRRSGFDLVASRRKLLIPTE
jgi:GNAT superfamily N-acetyltransferase